MIKHRFFGGTIVEYREPINEDHSFYHVTLILQDLSIADRNLLSQNIHAARTDKVIQTYYTVILDMISHVELNNFWEALQRVENEHCNIPARTVNIR